MLILALDSAMNGCGVGLHDFNRDIHISKTLQISRGQAESLLPMVNDVLSDAGKGFNDVTMIAVTHGPGAFTGLRIAMATAKSLGLALGIPVVGVCTFEAILHSFYNRSEIPPDSQKITVVLETKRQDFYIRAFDEEKRPISEKLALDANDAKALIAGSDMIIGDAVIRLIEKLSLDNCNRTIMNCPDTIAIAKLAISEPSMTCQPVYIRPPDAIISQKTRRIKSE